MECIKAGTELLKEKSKIFEASAGMHAKAGNELLSLTDGLTRYEGQLSRTRCNKGLKISRR